MKLIDLIMYINYNFASKTLNRPRNDAKWTAFLITSLYFTMILTILICSLGLLWENKLSVIFKDGGKTYWVLLGLISPIILAYRYYMNKNKFDAILNKFAAISTINGVLTILKYIIMIATPILLFCVFRIYVIGEIKWW